MSRDDKTKILASPGALAVMAGNPGFSFSWDQLTAISAGTLVLTPSKRCCITHLRYQNDGKDLTMVSFDDGTYVTSTQITNLGDFRERFQEAANFGHGVTFCEYKDKKTMTMLNIYPCQCKCDGRGSHD